MPLLDHESSRPYRVCLYVGLYLGQPPSCGGRQRPGRGQRLCVSPQVTSFALRPGLLRELPRGMPASQGNAWDAWHLPLSPPASRALPGLHSWSRVRISRLIICQKS